ncbi:hypothetical protein EW026_g6674 [Hermanssonia centrifuga]|uniref:Uncharacterized protein n=1 Tax=Hermanssonia centrifuga TaxID=98765 RepID=A0A4S4KB83_9APHY|nr:hypothetical protein EW026_g6674 [Hermanssonia centrifuga]
MQRGWAATYQISNLLYSGNYHPHSQVLSNVQDGQHVDEERKVLPYYWWNALHIASISAKANYGGTEYEP